MRLRIIDSNFTVKYDWLFKLVDENGVNSYIMNEGFYKRHNLKSPVSKKELDFYDKGQSIFAVVERIDEMNIVLGCN